jgi:hypothetical protein
MDRENFPFQQVTRGKSATRRAAIFARRAMRDSLIAEGLHDLRRFWKDRIRQKAQNSG